MHQDPFDRDFVVLGDTGSWGRVAEASHVLASFPSHDLAQEMTRHFAMLLDGGNLELVAAHSLALQQRGVPPSLRGAFPTTHQLRKGTATRLTLIMSDLLWLCSRGISLDKSADSVVITLQGKHFATALATVFRHACWLEGLLSSLAYGKKRAVLAKVKPYSNELVIVPYLLTQQERRIEPECIRQRLNNGDATATTLTNGGQQRQFDLGLVFRALYAANCFVVAGKGYAEAARYYNALIPASGKRISLSYMRKLYGRMKCELPKGLTTPVKPTKPKGDAMV